MPWAYISGQLDICGVQASRARLNSHAPAGTHIMWLMMGSLLSVEKAFKAVTPGAHGPVRSCRTTPNHVGCSLEGSRLGPIQ